MSMGIVIGETFLQAEFEYRRERAMMQFNRRPRRQRRQKRPHLPTPLGWRSWGQPHNGRPAVS